VYIFGGLNDLGISTNILKYYEKLPKDNVWKTVYP